jgi:hypothetical protein
VCSPEHPLPKESNLMATSKDLFDDSTMTFGEHLEVLRFHLIRALLGLMVSVVFMMPSLKILILKEQSLKLLRRLKTLLSEIITYISPLRQQRISNA